MLLTRLELHREWVVVSGISDPEPRGLVFGDGFYQLLGYPGPSWGVCSEGREKPCGSRLPWVRCLFALRMAHLGPRATVSNSPPWVEAVLEHQLCGILQKLPFVPVNQMFSRQMITFKRSRVLGKMKLLNKAVLRP